MSNAKKSKETKKTIQQHLFDMFSLEFGMAPIS